MHRAAHSELKLILLVWSVMLLRGSQVFPTLKLIHVMKTQRDKIYEVHLKQ